MGSAVEVKGLSKKYRLGVREKKEETLVSAAWNSLLAPVRNFKRIRDLSALSSNEDSIFWALRDVSFSVEKGEVLGIIGHNGAGKSTLLKILSQITDPSEGDVLLRGRVASLLEVGTGFHPELTGRENVYMNGTILGMRRREIDSKFDEIVDFSGVEKHIDTPVKFYSSGMKVRLGFAVAAHLDPEILIVDEVLAVGDIGFQRKCIGKMGEVSGSGKTILFVSHQMAAIQSLCSRALLLHHGRVSIDDTVSNTVRAYLAGFEPEDSGFLHAGVSRKGTGLVRIDSFELCDGYGEPVSVVATGSSVELRFTLSSEQAVKLDNLDIGFSIHSTEEDSLVTILYSSYVGQTFVLDGNRMTVRCGIESLPIPEGRYLIKAQVMRNGEVLDFPERGVGYLDVVSGDFYGTGVHVMKLTRARPSFLLSGSWTIVQ